MPKKSQPKGSNNRGDQRESNPDMDMEVLIKGLEDKGVLEVVLGDIELPESPGLFLLRPQLQNLFWSRVHTFCLEKVFPFIEEAALERRSQFQILEDEVCHPQLQLLRLLSGYLKEVMGLLLEKEVSGSLLDLIRSFQKFLPLVLELDCFLAEVLFGLIETWMLMGIKGCETLAEEALGFLFGVYFTMSRDKEEVLKRIHTLKDFFAKLNFSDPRNGPLHSAVIELLKSSSFASSSSSVQVVVDLMGFSDFPFILLHKYLVSKIINLPPSLNEMVSLAYYGRWRNSSLESREEMESLGLVDFLEKEILLPSPLASKIAGNEVKQGEAQPVGKFLRDFWNPFLENRDSEVDELLFQLFRIPIQRHSQMANALVRANSIKLLSRFFPMLDPGASIVQQSQTIEEQLSLLKASVYDSSPLVRATAIEATCFVFVGNWVNIPDTFRSEMLLFLVRDLAFDIGSVNCRIAVLAGLGYLFDHCARSRQPLRHLLPYLTKLINDGKDSVKNLYLDFLISVRSIFSDIPLPPPHILVGLLEVSSPSVSKRAGALLLDEYFPLAQSQEVKYQKFKELMACSTTAALTFYSNLPTYLAKSNASREALSKFACLLLEDTASLDLSVLEVAAVILRGIKPHLKSKACRSLSKALGADSLSSMLDRYSGKFTELAVVFDIISVCPTLDLALNKKLMDSVGLVLEAPDSDSVSFFGVFDFLVNTKQLDGYIVHLIQSTTASLSAQLNPPDLTHRPKKRARLTGASPGPFLRQIQKTSLHPTALEFLVGQSDFASLLSLLKKASAKIRAFPGERLTPDTQYLVDSTELFFRLSALEIEIRAENSNDHETLFIDKKAIANDALELAVSIQVSSDTTVGMAVLDTCLRLAPDLAMIEFLDSDLLLSYLRFFALNKDLKGIETYTQQAKLLDQATQLMEVYCQDQAENNADYVQELISAVSQGIEHLFGVIVNSDTLTQSKKLLQNMRPLVQMMVQLTLRRDQGAEYPAMLAGCLFGYLDVCSGDSVVNLAADILISALDKKLGLEPIPFAEMIPPRMNSFCNLSQVKEKLSVLTSAFPTSKFLELCSTAISTLELKPPINSDDDDIVEGEIRGYLCPCGCFRFATLSGEVLYWDPEDAD